MKDLRHKIVLLSLFVSFFAATAAAQSAPKTDARPTPFANGETLTYEGKISKIIKGIAVADLVFTITEPAPGEYLVKAEARSKGTLLKLFRYSFFQQVESTTADRSFRIAKTVKHDTQKDRVRDSEAIFDYKDERVTYTETDPKEPMRPPRTIASEIGSETNDLVTGLYRLRMLPLALGKTFELEVSDSGLVYKIPVKVTGRERQKSIFGYVYCYRVEPDIFGPDRLIDREGSMIIWITDDERRLPIRSQVNSPVGRFEIKLKSAKNLRS